MGDTKEGSAGQEPSKKEEVKESGIACSHNSTPSFLHLSLWCSLSVMLSPRPSLPPLIHLLPALPDKLFGPRKPVIHSTCQSWQQHQHHTDQCSQAGRQAGRARAQSARATRKKPQGSTPMRVWSQGPPHSKRVSSSSLVTELSHTALRYKLSK